MKPSEPVPSFVSPEDRLTDEALEFRAAVCCPVCDVDGRSQLEALAIGVALGVAYRDIHRITASMCADHRSQWFLAMVNVCLELFHERTK